MSARPVMTCEACRDLLIELVCDELPADTAAEARAHALTCERCGPELAKLERTLKVASDLPLLVPSPEVERRIMQAARAAVAGKAKGPAREQPISETGFAGWFARVSAWAMSPQVAMASVLLLVVGIGLYALPIGHSPESTALRATEEEQPVEERPQEPSASAIASPVPAPEPAAEERRERTPLRDERLGGATAPRAEGMAKTRPATRAAKPKSPSKGAYDAFDNAAGGASYGRADDELQPREKEEAKPVSEAKADRAASAGRGGFAPPPPPAAAPAPVSAPKKVQALEPEASARIAKEPVTQLLGALAQGIAASQRGDYAQAEKLLTPVAKGGAGAERMQATLWLARSLRAQGDCARALPYYRALTQPVSADRDVLEEAADCYARTGNEPQASRLRARAQAPAQKARD